MRPVRKLDVFYLKLLKRSKAWPRLKLNIAGWLALDISSLVFIIEECVWPTMSAHHRNSGMTTIILRSLGSLARIFFNSGDSTLTLQVEVIENFGHSEKLWQIQGSGVNESRDGPASTSPNKQETSKAHESPPKQLCKNGAQILNAHQGAQAILLLGLNWSTFQRPPRNENTLYSLKLWTSRVWWAEMRTRHEEKCRRMNRRSTYPPPSELNVSCQNKFRSY